MKILLFIFISIVAACAADLRSYTLNKYLISKNGFDTLIYIVKIDISNNVKVDIKDVCVNIKSGPLADTDERINPKLSEYVSVNQIEENTFKIRIPLFGFNLIEFEKCSLKGSFEDIIDGIMNDTCPDSLYFYKLDKTNYFIVVRIPYFTTNIATFPGEIEFVDEIEIK